jgi:hypothetical protein
LDKAFGITFTTGGKASQPKKAAPAASAAKTSGGDGGSPLASTPSPTAAASSATSATCWSRDCSAKFPERECETAGSLSVECDALIDAGVAYPTREACCRRVFGPAGCGTGCYVPKEQAQGQGQGQSTAGYGGSSSSTSTTSNNPNRECALLSEPARCLARRRANLPAYATERECCAATFGSGGGTCMRFPDRCYAADPDWPGQCRAVDGASECAALYWAARDKALASGVVLGDDGGLASDDDDEEDEDDGNTTKTNTTTSTIDPSGRRQRDLGFSLTRARCCARNAYDRADCAQTVECYEADHGSLPSRRCRVTESARCLERMAAGLAYSTRSECCATAFGPGRGCRDFPPVCYRFDPRRFDARGEPLRPFDACPLVEDASVDKCALLLEQDGLAAREAAKEAARAAKEAARANDGTKRGAVIGDGAPSPPSPLPQPLTTPRVFEQRVDCCAAAMPLGFVDYGSPDLARGCPYAPSSCWAPMKARARPRPGVPAGSFDVFCAPVRDRPAVECARRVSAGTAWVTRDECCRRVGGCARLPPSRASAQQAAAVAGGKGSRATIVRGPADPRARAAVAAMAAQSVGGGDGGSSRSSRSSSDIGEKVVLVRRRRDGVGAGAGAGAGGAAAAAAATARGGGGPAAAKSQGGGQSPRTQPSAPAPAPAAPPPPPRPRRPRTEREIATEPEPEAAAAAPWIATERERRAREEEQRRQEAIATATAGSAPPRTVLPALQSARQLYQREPGVAAAKGSGGHWGDAEEDAAAAAPSWPATPIEPEARPPEIRVPPPSGPAPVAAAPFAGPAYRVSGRRRRRD